MSAMHTPCTCRRRLLLGLALAGGLVAIGGLTACGESSSGSSRPPGPAEITASTVCELDGMQLADYGGPKGQIHFDGTPQPVFFCDTVELLSELIQPERVRKVAAAYVQDMGKADWDRPQGHWIDARTALYVRGSKRMGSMGPTFASFAQESDARRFVGEYGGTVLRFSEIDANMVDLSGGAKGDTRM